MSDLSAEVCSQVQRFWDILTGASQHRFEDLYSSSAIAFTGTGKRSEQASLISIRRVRQRTAARSTSSVEIGPINVQVAAPDVAIATYTYRFHSTAVHKDGSLVQMDTLFGRATQVFQHDGGGSLRIVHEHLSSAAPSRIEKTGPKRD
jgi:ketosteroid isomerase-like protein